MSDGKEKAEVMRYLICFEIFEDSRDTNHWIADMEKLEDSNQNHIKFHSLVTKYLKDGWLTVPTQDEDETELLQEVMEEITVKTGELHGDF